MFYFRPAFQLQRPTTHPTCNITPNGLPVMHPPEAISPAPTKKAEAEGSRNRDCTPIPPGMPRATHQTPNAPHIRHNVPHKPTHILTSHSKQPQSHPQKQLKYIQLPGRPQYRLIKCFFRVLRKL